MGCGRSSNNNFDLNKSEAVRFALEETSYILHTNMLCFKSMREGGGGCHTKRCYGKRCVLDAFSPLVSCPALCRGVVWQTGVAFTHARTHARAWKWIICWKKNRSLENELGGIWGKRGCRG